MLYLTLNRHGVAFKKAKAVQDDIWYEWQLHERAGIQFWKPKHTPVRPLAKAEVAPYVHPPFGHLPADRMRLMVEARLRLEERKKSQMATSPGTGLFGSNTSENGTETLTPIEEVPPEGQNPLEDARVKALAGYLMKPGVGAPGCSLPGPGTKFADPMTTVVDAGTLAELRDKGKLDMNRPIIANKKGEHYYVLYDGQHCFREQFEKIMADGCVCCAERPGFMEPVKFLKDNSFVCWNCMTSCDKSTLETVFHLLKQMA